MRYLWQEESDDGDGPLLEEEYGVGDTAFYRTGDGFSVYLSLIASDDYDRGSGIGGGGGYGGGGGGDGCGFGRGNFDGDGYSHGFYSENLAELLNARPTDTE